MILLDTTILVTYLRTRSPLIERVFADRPVAVSGVTRAELLHGARDDADLVRLTGFLEEFVQLQVTDAAWDALGRNLYLLRRRGIAVPFQDALIATLAITADAEVWSYDGHFALMQPGLPGLRLFAGPKP